MTKELIDELVKEAVEKNWDIASYVYTELKTIQEIRNQVREIEYHQRNCEEGYKAKINEIKIQLRAIQEKCSHRTFTFHGDASGNNDSFHQCDICKKQW